PTCCRHWREGHARPRSRPKSQLELLRLFVFERKNKKQPPLETDAAAECRDLRTARPHLGGQMVSLRHNALRVSAGIIESVVRAGLAVPLTQPMSPEWTRSEWRPREDSNLGPSA